MTAVASIGRRTAPRESSGSGDLLTRGLDAVISLAVLSFAIWTLLYQIAQLLRLPTDPVVAAWLVLSVAVAVAAGRLRYRAPAATVAGPACPGRGERTCWWIAALLALMSVGLVLGGAGAMWLAGWAVGAASLGVTAGYLLWSRRRRGHSEPSEHLPARWWSSVLVAVTALGCGWLSLVALRPDGDDAYYVNRAVFIATHGRIPLRDTLYSHEVFPPIAGAGAAPVQSVEALQGALAHVAGLQAGTVVYLVWAPLATFAAVWALWRLLRTWSARWPELAWVLAMVYLLFDAGGGYGFGAFFLTRMWQGKVTFVAVLVPLIYHYITRWAQHGRRSDAVLIVACGVCAVGLTSSGTFIAPLIAVAVTVSLALTGHRWWAALLPACYPVVTGGVLAIVSPPGNPGGAFLSGAKIFAPMFGYGFLQCIAWAGILLGAWLARGGAARVVVTAAAAAMVVVLAPGFAAVFSNATGAGAVAWRLLWVAPVPAMVGLLVALPTRWLSGRSGHFSTRRTAIWSVALTAALCVAVAAAGVPLWSSTRHVVLEDHPTWKYPVRSLDQARAIVARKPGPGPVLSTLGVMRALALTSTDVLAVDPRPSYVGLLDEPADDTRARRVLVDLVNGERVPRDAAVSEALQRLDVSLVCLPRSQHVAFRAVERAGYRATSPARGLACREPGDTVGRALP